MIFILLFFFLVIATFCTGALLIYNCEIVKTEDSQKIAHAYKLYLEDKSKRSHFLK